MIEIVSLVLNLVLGSSLVLFYSANKRKQSAEAGAAEIEVRQGEFEINRQQIAFLSSQLTEAYTEIDKMQDIINEKRNQIIELIRQTKNLEVELINGERYFCKNLTCLTREKNENM